MQIIYIYEYNVSAYKIKNMVRTSGILFHISSLPSKYGIGTLGREAYNFIDFMCKAKLHIWQILPLTVTSYGDSPYQSPSSIALNPYFIDLEFLIEDGLLTKEECDSINWGDNKLRVNYDLLFKNRNNLLFKAFERFNKNDDKYQSFLNKKEYFDYALFMTLKELHNYKPWSEWEEKSRIYKIGLSNEIADKYKEKIEFYQWTQYIFLKQFNNLKEYAHKHDVKLMGDMPIYVAYDSLEVWKYPELFQLDKNHYPTRVAGCPPDCFSEDGQLWGNPLYNYDYMKKNNYEWWNQRILYNLKLYDIIRIDHFRGFSGYYSIPFGDKTARNGKWVKGPGAELFKDKLNLPIVAEDLGMMDDDFYKMMDVVKYPGMKIITQCFDDPNTNNIWRPSNYTENFFSYSGTHDSQTTRQFINELSKERKALMESILDDECNRLNVEKLENKTNELMTLKICELNFASKAEAAITPLQDFLTIGKEGRMNFPSTLSTNNWSWRVDKDEFTKKEDELINKINSWVNKYKR